MGGLKQPGITLARPGEGPLDIQRSESSRLSGIAVQLTGINGRCGSDWPVQAMAIYSLPVRTHPEADS
jgi:hypothetical protein